MSEKTSRSGVTSFRMPVELEDKLSKFRQIKEVTLQDVIRSALTEYLDRNLTNTERTIELIHAQENVNEYMYIPEKYYLLFNNLKKIEFDKEVKDKTVRVITLGDISLVMVKVSKSIYKKAELIALKNEVSSLKQEFHTLKNITAKLKRDFEKTVDN